MSFFRKNQASQPAKFGSLHEAVEAGDLAAVQAFVRGGTDPNAQTANGATPLHLAAARGRLEIARFLIDSGSEVDFLIDEGGTPLMSAAAAVQPALIELLLSKGAQPGKKGNGGRSPITCLFQPAVVSMDNQLKCLGLLVERGAAVNDPSDSGLTPLMNAAWFGNLEAAKELLKQGADSSLKDQRGRTAAALAFERHHDSLAQLLAASAGESH